MDIGLLCRGPPSRTASIPELRACGGPPLLQICIFLGARLPRAWWSQDGLRSSCHPVPANTTLLCLWPRCPLWTVMPESSLRWEAPLSELPSSAPGLHVNLTTNFGHGLKSRLYTVPHFLRKAGRRETTGHSVPLGKMNCLAPCVRIFESWP